MVEFVDPVIHNGDVYVKRNFDVGGNSHMSGNLTVDGTVHLNGNLDIAGNVSVDGTVLAKKFLPGQVVNVAMLSNADIGQVEIETGGSGTLNTIFTFSYIPKYNYSYLAVEYQTMYILSDSYGTDYINVSLYVNDEEIGKTNQKWFGQLGGGNRSGVLFPIIGRYTNSDKTAKVITLKLFNNTNDSFTVKSDVSTWLKITEIAR